MNNKPIPTLTADDIECRVQSVSKAKNGKVGAVLLLYKNARVDMRILDAVYGVGDWQRTHEVIDGKLFCTLEIWDSEKGQWIKKQDVGVESNAEKEKGQASDAFKRACFNVGIGRELYTSPFIYVELRDGEYYTDNHNGRETYKCSATTRFEVVHIAYNARREISELRIVDRFGNERYTFDSAPSAAPRQTPRKPPEPPKMPDRPIPPEIAENFPLPFDEEKSGDKCPSCGGAITEAERRYSMSKFGRVLCRTCQKAAI